MADAAKKDFDLNVVFIGVAPRNRRGTSGDFALAAE
jgi:hypothetical protein